MSPTLTTLIVALLSALFGTGGGFALAVKWKELKDKREESEIVRLREDIRQAEERHQKCEAGLADVKARLTIVEHHHTSYLARWIKDATKRVIWLNDKAFLSIFAPLGLTREDVIESRFSEILDASASAETERLDQAALAHPEVAASNVIQLHPLLPAMIVVTIAAIGRDGELVFECYAYRTNDRMIADGMGAARTLEALGASGDHLLPEN